MLGGLKVSQECGGFGAEYWGYVEIRSGFTKSTEHPNRVSCVQSGGAAFIGLTHGAKQTT